MSRLDDIKRDWLTPASITVGWPPEPTPEQARYNELAGAATEDIGWLVGEAARLAALETALAEHIRVSWGCM